MGEKDAAFFAPKTRKEATPCISHPAATAPLKALCKASPASTTTTAATPEDCGDCRFYRPDWKYQFCVYAECPYQPGKLTALDAVKFQVKGVDDEMAVFQRKEMLYPMFVQQL